ncbi:hypothetical protein K0M31_015919, partial [Melipona bicolor]
WTWNYLKKTRFITQKRETGGNKFDGALQDTNGESWWKETTVPPTRKKEKRGGLLNLNKDRPSEPKRNRFKEVERTSREIRRGKEEQKVKKGREKKALSGRKQPDPVPAGSTRREERAHRGRVPQDTVCPLITAFNTISAIVSDAASAGEHINITYQARRCPFRAK